MKKRLPEMKFGQLYGKVRKIIMNYLISSPFWNENFRSCGNETYLHPIIMYKKRKKIYYVPGLISLLALPFLLFQFNPLPLAQTVLKLNLPNDETNKNENGFIFSSENVMQTIKQKKKLNIDLDEDHELNKNKLEIIRVDAARLQYYGDTTTIIKVNFSADVSYKEFVFLLNILNKYKIKRYAWVYDSMIIFGGT